jgi:hypothetical protein
MTVEQRLEAGGPRWIRLVRPQLKAGVMWLSRISLFYLTAILNGGSHHATGHNTVRH